MFLSFKNGTFVSNDYNPLKQTKYQIIKPFWFKSKTKNVYAKPGIKMQKLKDGFMLYKGTKKKTSQALNFANF